LGNEGALPETTESLLRNPDKITEWLLIADRYMQTYVENPRLVVLPRAHEFLRPLIEGYAKDLGGFAEYILDLRDQFARNSAQFKDIQAVYRRFNGRWVQQHRRERMIRAVEKAESLYGEIPYTKRMQWMADVEHEWAQRRLAFLEQQRRRLKVERVSTELRTEFLLEFWDIIDTEIYEGKLPPWN
jgi:hypothetical protein